MTRLVLPLFNKGRPIFGGEDEVIPKTIIQRMFGGAAADCVAEDSGQPVVNESREIRGQKRGERGGRIFITFI